MTSAGGSRADERARRRDADHPTDDPASPLSDATTEERGGGREEREERSKEFARTGVLASPVPEN